MRTQQLETHTATQTPADLSERCHGSSDIFQVCDWTLQMLRQLVNKWEDLVHVGGSPAVESSPEGSFPEMTLLSECQLQLLSVEEDRTHGTEGRELWNLHLQLLQGQEGIMGKKKMLLWF